ncbi:MAG: hypothetical protein ABSH40_11320 [Bryobacteraceae bacterium]|jgi:hypothetical protein
MIRLAEFSAVRAGARRTLRPRNKLGRATLGLGGLSVLMMALQHLEAANDALGTQLNKLERSR